MRFDCSNTELDFFNTYLSLECMKNFHNHLLANIWSYFCSYTLMRFKLRICTFFLLHCHNCLLNVELQNFLHISELQSCAVVG